MKNKFIVVFYLVIILILTGCTSQKELAYFNEITEKSAGEINSYFKSNYETTIVPGDQITIVVSGTPEAVLPFNNPVVAYASPGSKQIYSQPTLQPYLVDAEGYVNFPVIGKIKLGGLNKSESIDFITEKLKPHLKDPIVNINFVNYKITVLGEVQKPGQYPVATERITVLDALGLAGDLTIYGKRGNILITREKDGKLEFARLNLNSDEVFKSPYYYLQQNDVIYVEPNGAKSVSAQNLPLYLSGISTIGTLLTLIFTISKK
ncbi:MAG: polysaccharide biosynthesis/export family protein [Paludibacteraceae bacterium]